MNKNIGKKISALSLACLMAFGPVNGKAAESPKIKQMAGKNFDDTVYQIGKESGYQDKTAFVVREDDFSDALTAAVLAGEKGGFIVFSDGNKIDEKQRELVDGAKETKIVGGDRSISGEVEKSLPNYQGRIAGEDRYITALHVARELGVERDIVVCSGENWPDALVASSFANNNDCNIILVEKDDIPASVASFLKVDGQGKRVAFFGGDRVISKETKERVLELTGNDESKADEFTISGKNRYETSHISAKRQEATNKLILANGDDYREALAIAPMAGDLKAPLVLVHNNKDKSFMDLLDQTKPSEIYIAGGDRSVSLANIALSLSEVSDLEKEKISVQDVDGNDIKINYPEEKKEEPKKEEKKDEKTIHGKKYLDSFICKATAYDPSAGTRTASGLRAAEGRIAVDPRKIPLGTKLYVESTDSWGDYGFCVAADTGGAIKGNRVDLFFNSNKTARQFGRRNVKVYILAE